MVDINLEPMPGDTVRVLGRPGVFTVEATHSPGSHPNRTMETPETRLYGSLDIVRVKDGFRLQGISRNRILPPDDLESARRFIVRLRESGSLPFFDQNIVDWEIEDA